MLGVPVEQSITPGYVAPGEASLHKLTLENCCCRTFTNKQ